VVQKKMIIDHDVLPVTQGQAPDDPALPIDFDYGKVSGYVEKKIDDRACAHKTRCQVFKERCTLQLCCFVLYMKLD